MSVRLSPETQRRVDALFAPTERMEVARILRDECGNILPFLEKSDEFHLERVRFAALKLSGGNLPKLREAVRVAEQDWRDVLIAAEFAHEINAHKNWFPTTMTDS